MDYKLTILFVLGILAALVYADFNENHVSPREEDLEMLGLTCIPGRTVLRLEDVGFSDSVFNKGDSDSDDSSEYSYNQQRGNNDFAENQEQQGYGGEEEVSDNDAEFGDNDVSDRIDGEVEVLRHRKGKKKTKIARTRTANAKSVKKGGSKVKSRRSHMNFQAAKDESCKVCVCSVEGKDEYCSSRPAMNVNECLRMADVMEEFQKNVPFDSSRVLAYRIRRRSEDGDYIWHDDEIPYEPNAKCVRGRSYYTNDPNANNSDIDKPTDLESLLDYAANDTCYFCICSVSGRSVACIPRSVWFCEYFRFYRRPEAIRDVYRVMFKQDRPAYFRSISWRMRRTMDNAIYDFIDVVDTGGDTLCCDHPSGHLRSMHRMVRNRIMSNMRRKMPKENLLNKNSGPRGDYDDFIVNNDKKK